MTTQREVADALARPEPLSAAECGALMQKISLAIAELQPDWERMHPGAVSVQIGAERKAALLSGDDAEVRRVKEEFEKVDAVRSSLKAQNMQLHELRQAAVVREAFEGLPAMQAALVDRITDAEAIRKQLESALDDVEAAYTEVTRARGLCHSGGFSGAEAETFTIARLVDLAPVSARPRVSCCGRERVHADNLGPRYDHLRSGNEARWTA